MGIKPAIGQVLVREIEREAKTKSGIILAQEKKNFETFDAQVIATNKDSERKYKDGVLVIVDKSIVKEVVYGEINYQIVPEECIIATIEKE